VSLVPFDYSNLHIFDYLVLSKSSNPLLLGSISGVCSFHH
jgi:hypothetical protein